MLTICEELFILALEDEEGDIVESVVDSLESVLAGATLAELVLQKRIELVEDRIVVTDPTSTDHPILDKALFDIIDTTKPRKLKYWINTLTYKKFLDEIGHHLVEIGILARKKKRLHLVIPNSADAEGKLTPKVSLKNRLREIVLIGSKCDPFERVLLALLYRSGLTKLVFTLGERKAAQKRAKKLIASTEEGNPFSATLVEILDEVCPTRH